MRIATFFKLSISMTFCITTISMYGQARVIARQNGANTELYFTRAVEAPTYNEVIGTPYLYKDFVPARVNEIEMTFFIRFNVHDNNIEFKGEDDIIYSMTKPNDYNIKLLDGSNKIYETLDYEDGKKEVGNTFFERIHATGEFALYYRELIEYTPVKLARNSFETNKPAKFIKTKGDFYYRNLKADSSKLLKLPKREKLFLKQFDKHATTVKKLMQKEKLKNDVKEDLIQILEFYFDQ